MSAQHAGRPVYQVHPVAHEVLQREADRLTNERAHLLAALREIVALTDEDTGTFRKRGGTYRGLVGMMAAAAIAAAEGQS